jgi:Ca2+-binding EF-hand superfamily protein
MSIEQVIQFMEKTAQDEALQQQLQKLMGTGDGDISGIAQLDASEAAALKGRRGTDVVELAAKNGFKFSSEELIKVIDVFEKRQSGELSEAEFTNFISSSNLNQDTKNRLFSNEQTIDLVFLGRRYTKKVAPTTQTITTISAITPEDLPSSTVLAQVIEFMEKTSQDEALQKQLQSAIGVGDGNISNIQELDASEATALKGKYGASVVKLAKENGFNFSSNDLIKVIDIFEKHQAGEISEAKFSEFLASSNLNKYAARLSSAEKTIDLIFQGRRYRKTVTTQVPANSTHQATAQVVQFMEKTGDDSQLKQELKQILEVGDGDISSVDELDAEEAQALKSQKNSLVIELASKYGFQFTVEDLNKVIDIFGQQKVGEISLEDFSLLTGIADAKKSTSVELMYLGRRYRKTTLPNGEVKIEYIDNKKMRSAKSTAVISFMLKTAEDATLKQEVKSALGVGDGDISTITELDDEEATALKGKQGSAVIKLATKYGFQFSVDDLTMVVDAFEQRQAGKISQKEFALKTGLSELEKQSGQGLSLFQKTVNFFSGKR